MTKENDSPFVEINSVAVDAKRLQRKEQAKAAEQEKTQEGRYTLKEAGAMLDSATNHGGEALLMAAAMSGALKVHAPGNAAELPCSDVKEQRNYLEAYWDELNGWIDENAKRIQWRFPNPQEAVSARPSTEKANTSSITGVDRNKIIAAFPPPVGVTPKNWSKTLSSPPKWLSGARLCNGKPSVSALWNPARFAMAYADKGCMTKPNLTTIIRREFAEWLPEWEKYTASF